MSTQTLHVNCNARPVRLAFLVDKPDPAVLEQIFSVNTVLWGGLLNPVVILDGSARKQVGVHYELYAKLGTPHEDETLALLRGFDPDLLINYSNVRLPASLDAFKDRTFGPEQMKWNPWGTEEIAFFLECWPFLEQYWREEVRFLQRPARKFGYLDLHASAHLKTYLMARFGNYADEGNAILADHFGASPVTYDEEFRKSLTIDDWIFPIQITCLQVSVPVPDSFGGHAFFLLDPANMFDVVDFWNLRAAGFRIFPLPVDHYRDFAPSAKAFADRATYPINKGVMNLPEIVKGRSVEDSQLKEAGEWIQSLGPRKEGISLKGWVPRFGEGGYRVAPEIQVRPPTSQESKEIVLLENGHGTLRGPVLDCELAGAALSQHWAMDFRCLGSGGEDRVFRLPWLHPECDKLANHKTGMGFGAESSRVSKEAIVVFRRGHKESVWFEEPRVTEVLRAYLQDGGFTYLNTSSPGLALERIVEQMGGLMQCSIFQNPGVRDIVDKLSDGSAMHAEEARKILHRSLSDRRDEEPNAFERILARLVSSRVLRQGLHLQCSRCRRHEWYHLVDLGEEFKCKKCFHVQDIPFLDKRPWHYVSDGLFRLEDKTGGCLTAVLSLVFLRSFFNLDMKYVTSFDYTDGAERAERDFAVLVSDFFQYDVDVIIAECKTSRELDEKQKSDLRCLGTSTGAYLAICTLSSEFTEGDKIFFRELITSGLRPILITRKHLELPYFDAMKYKHGRHSVGREAELLSRLTVREALGDEFADKNRLWI